MNHLEKMKAIDFEVYKNMEKTSQATINLVEEIVSDLEDDFDEFEQDQSELIDYFKAKRYKVKSLLEIWNPNLGYDIYILEKCLEVFED